MTTATAPLSSETSRSHLQESLFAWLDTLGIPYSGSGVKASAVGMHKPAFKAALTASIIDTPR